MGRIAVLGKFFIISNFFRYLSNTITKFAALNGG